MEYYYDRGAGKTKFSWIVKRNSLKAMKWYFQDRFGFTINVIGLFMVVF